MTDLIDFTDVNCYRVQRPTYPMPKPLRNQEASLVGIAEIAEMAHASRQQVYNWSRRRPDMPRPVAILRCGPIWSKAAIAKWLKESQIAPA